MRELLRDPRVLRLLVANTLGSIGSGVTIFAVPWLLVNRAGGGEVFRWTTIGTTVVLFLFMPHYGAWIDRHSRKTMLLASELFGLAATGLMAATALIAGRVDTWQLVVTYFCGMMYYTLHYPAKFAFIQQIFERSQYQSLMGLLEIQGQMAMMIAGGLGGYLVDQGIPLWAILLFDAATYGASFALLSSLPYEATHLEGANTPSARTSVWHSVREGWRWLQERPQLTLYLSCSLMPFIVVMASNYLFPIYVAQTLAADAKVFGAGEITFALGAMAAGAALPLLIARHSGYHTITVTSLIFSAGLAVLVWLPFTSLYLIAGVLMGFGNAGCRVARSALMLHVVPNEVMGRVNTFYQVFDRLLRTVLVAALGIIDLVGPQSGFLLLLGVMIISFAGLLRSRAAIRGQI
jgi:MFS family permease